MPEKNDLVESKLGHLKTLRENGINPYPYHFEANATSQQLHQKYESLAAAEETQETTCISGRIKIIRSFGKLVFLDVWDHTGKIQVQAKEDETDKESLFIVENLDPGDWIGIEGRIIKTKRGELTVLAKKFTVLSKSIQPLPEKWHGLTDTETRYRQRHLDLIMNPEVKRVFEKRSQIIKTVREYLDQHGFVEVEIPSLQPVYGGANAKPFKTLSNALKQELYLSISPELYLKRLIVGGFDKVYFLGKSFRNEDIDKTHNPEFTIMECYAANWDYNDMMKLFEDMYNYVAKKVTGTTQIEYDGTIVDLKAPWRRLPVKQGLKEYANIDVDKLKDAELIKLVKHHAPDYDGPQIRGLLIAELFEALVEEKLGKQPVFITDYPAETTPLCKAHRDNPELIERFEPLVNGWEAGNAYSELNDPVLQRKLLEQQASEGRAGGTAEPVDEDFINAIEYGMPPTGGLGVGIDRMVMLLTGQSTIKDVVLWPLMKNKEEKKPETK
ncbi:MAG: lysine--tRNA ligase [Candidatus Diapherotrites archaeon]|uniref:Lysine--tRNA ligase n=1 Tax=Candidatus Iainarchaeum sp. TaxID=3101447 RepID=A0A8T4L1Z5_9ARCH|nr:lysine--tRNA ligase [Candidatus Diapherotrites archaeon]